MSKKKPLPLWRRLSIPVLGEDFFMKGWNSTPLVYRMMFVTLYVLMAAMLAFLAGAFGLLFYVGILALIAHPEYLLLVLLLINFSAIIYCGAQMEYGDA